MFGDDDLACSRIPEAPALEIRRIAHKDAQRHVGVELGACVALDMHVCATAPGAQMRNIWFALVPQLEWHGLARVHSSRLRGQAIPDVHEQSHRLGPERLGQARLRECSDDGLDESVVRVLRDAILCRTVASRVARLYATGREQRVPLLANKLATLVVLELANATASLILSPAFEIAGGLEGVRLATKGIRTVEAASVICEEHKVVRAAKRANRHLNKISMDQVKNTATRPHSVCAP